MSTATELRNYVGAVRWQPTLQDGRRLYTCYSDRRSETKYWIHPPERTSQGYDPVMYSSKKRAERVAKRQERRDADEKWLASFEEFREVGK